MGNLTSSLAAFAVKIFQNKQNLTIPQINGLEFYPDSILAAARYNGNIDITQLPEAKVIISQIISDPSFVMLAPRPGELDPMLIHLGGGSRQTLTTLINGIFSGAFVSMYFLGVPEEESAYVRAVLDAFEELRKAVSGAAVHASWIIGIAGICIPNDRTIHLPWGEVRAAPQVGVRQSFIIPNRPQATCLLIQSQLTPVIFDRSPNPKNTFDRSYSTQRLRGMALFQLACALASNDLLNPISALETWETTRLPFQSYSEFSWPLISKWHTQSINVGALINNIEEWAKIVEQNHTQAVDLASSRLISAISQRNDPADALIDAVMVWENLVGTSQEVTFRVSAALSKIIETEPSNRDKRKRDLAKVYSVRSSLVHGRSVPSDRIVSARALAVSTAIHALRVFYKKGRDWMSESSEERSDTILLKWP